MNSSRFVRELAAVDDAEDLACDVLIVGGGPAGLTVARSVAGCNMRVLVLESGGIEPGPDAEDLNEVIVGAGTWTEAQATRRTAYHAPQAPHWSHSRQGYGVRCRGLGGATAAWAGKSAAFGAIDFEERPWVPHSGWPLRLEDLESNLERAARVLNLGPNCYGDALWALMKRQVPEPRPDPERLESFFWQFARSTINPMDVLRAGAEFLKDPPPGCRVLTGATVLEVLTRDAGRCAVGVTVADGAGRRRAIRARATVLAASAIENARLLLNSEGEGPAGLGNATGWVGRCLMDHPGAVIGAFKPEDIAKLSRLYGFYGVKGPNGVHMYMRGLTPSPRVQKEEGLLNCAAFMPGERAPDDPWDAVRRLLKGGSTHWGQDLSAILRSPRLVAVGAGRLALQSPRFPERLKRATIDQVLRRVPGLAVGEYLTGGVPHKLVSLQIQAVCEQVPDPENRVFLAQRRDRFGQRLPAVRWRVGELETRTLVRLAGLIREEFAAAGLPRPQLADWVLRGDVMAAGIIDMAHSSGTTRMSATAHQGVVDAQCQVHGVAQLFVAGASVFPTSGHANPTLMIAALADRLGLHLRGVLTRRVEATPQLQPRPEGPPRGDGRPAHPDVEDTPENADM
ncbi:GMC oxidoreductase (plasmid) [Salipiger sp. H15]|uniref:GMC oxidoreductase n=1 Tax=Alloyangia sp. H15 TaxID=3029062 RepID=A0AAU8ARV6_9RHOB